MLRDRTSLFERRFAEGKEERLADLAAELVQLKVDVIVVGGTAAARAARRLTKTIPIVIPDSADPVAGELVASLSRPGGNITGLTMMSPKLSGKRLELLKESFPTILVLLSSSEKEEPTIPPFLGPVGKLR
jgi:putative ABC transport system substrate-binding protein